MVDIDRYRRLVADIEAAQREADQADGVYREYLQQIKEKYGCTTLEAAEQLAQEKKAAADASEVEYLRLLDEYEKEWENNGSEVTDD